MIAIKVLNHTTWIFLLKFFFKQFEKVVKKKFSNKDITKSIIFFGIIKVYVCKLFKLKNDGKKEYLHLLSICTANLNGINNMNHIQTLFKVFSIDNRLSM